MADQVKDKQDQHDKQARQEKKDRKARDAAQAAVAVATGPQEPPPPVRLAIHYDKTVRPALAKAFGLANPHQVPKITKIVLNVGFGAAQKAPKAIDAIAAELGQITGQRPVITRAKKAIANFSLRKGVPIGVMVTLRGPRMYEFLDRFISVAVPRMRDFRGLPANSFDGRGNYTFGIKEQMIFPEIDYDKVERIHGMDITIVTTAGRDDMAMALLREMGWPFRGEQPVLVGQGRTDG